MLGHVKNGLIPASFSNYIFCRFKRDSSLDHWSWRKLVVNWSVDHHHHHGPNSITLFIFCPWIDRDSNNWLYLRTEFWNQTDFKSIFQWFILKWNFTIRTFSLQTGCSHRHTELLESLEMRRDRQSQFRLGFRKCQLSLDNRGKNIFF